MPYHAISVESSEGQDRTEQCRKVYGGQIRTEQCRTVYGGQIRTEQCRTVHCRAVEDRLAHERTVQCQLQYLNKMSKQKNKCRAG
jgi:hypothetical protein